MTDNIIDARGMRCPWPVLRLARALRMKPGTFVTIVADDPVAFREITAFADAHAMTVSSVHTPIGDGFAISPR